MEQGREKVKKDLITQDDVLKNYLLGSLVDEETMRLIEETLLLDDDFEERFSIAEEELIEEYLDDALDAAERGRFTEIFLAAPDRKQKLRLSSNLRRIAAEAEIAEGNTSEDKTSFFNWKDWFSVRQLGFAAVVLALFGIGYAVWRVGFYESDIDKGLAQMRVAYRGQRPTESRTTAGFDYAPFSVMRGGEQQTAADDKARARAERFLFDASEDEKNAASHNALGLLYLAERKFDAALRELNKAVELAPQNAKFQNDLGAVYLEKTKIAADEKNGGEFFENADSGLRHINRALEIDANLLEALFNKALLLQKMRLDGQAKEAWNKYVEKDNVSPWADEARKNLKLLEQQDNLSKDNAAVLNDFLDAYRGGNEEKARQIVSETKEFVTGLMVAPQLAVKFLEADAQGKNDEAAEMSAAFVWLGEIEKKHTGDAYSDDLAAYYKNTSAEQRKILQQAQTITQTAQKLLLESNFTETLENFEQAKKLFLSAGNVWDAQVVEYQICYSLFQLGKTQESNERLFALAEFGEQKGYKWLKVLADNRLGDSYLALGETSRAIDFNQKSLKLSEETSDVYNIQRNLNNLAEEYRSINNSQKAMDYIYPSLMYPVSYYSFPRQKWRNLFFTTQILYSFKFYDAASAYAGEEISFAENELKDVWTRHLGLIHSGIIYGSLQKYTEALEQIEKSYYLAGTFRDKEMSLRLSAQSLVRWAHLQRQTGDCAGALEKYDRAIEVFEKLELAPESYEARKGRLSCFVTQENNDAVRSEMSVLMKLFDENRKKISDETDRNVFFDNEQTVYDIAADYAYTNLKDTAQAFDYAENSRARSLLDSIKKNPEQKQPLSLQEVRAQIPPQTQIVYYAVLPDKILIWYISGTKFVTVEKRVKREDLEAKVSEYTKNMQSGMNGAKIRSSGKELYELLIGAVENVLEKDKTICIIADKQLLQIPFASLVSAQTDRYLIEDHTLLFAPSATVFITESNIAANKPENDNETILSIGNPSFSNTEHPELGDLPSAAEEAKKSAAFYGSSKIFIGNEADGENFTNNLNGSDIVHYAGHYVPNAKNPALSKFLLASGDLRVEKIAGTKLSRVRLLILSACETGAEKLYQGEGMIGAARTFLAADVPLVVASNWAVESDATARLMIKFHFYRKQNGMSSTESLRRAQIDMLSDKDSNFRHPFYWAGFLPIGGYAAY